MDLLCLILLIVSYTAVPGPAQASSLPAFNPILTVQTLTPQQITTAVADGYFQLTPNLCSTSSSTKSTHKVPGSSGSSRTTTQLPTCTGFRLSNDATFATAVNSVTFTPAKEGVIIDPMGQSLYRIGTLNLTNKGFTQPADAAMILVTIKGSITIATPMVNKPTNLPIQFQVMWSTGNPAPPNKAGLFILITKYPAPSFPFKIAMTQDINFNMNLKLVGFAADPKLGAGVEVFGDWGQAKPKLGQPGPRVYVKEGSTQVVQMYALIQNTDQAPL